MQVEDELLYTRIQHDFAQETWEAFGYEDKVTFDFMYVPKGEIDFLRYSPDRSKDSFFIRGIGTTQYQVCTNSNFNWKPVRTISQKYVIRGFEECGPIFADYYKQERNGVSPTFDITQISSLQQMFAGHSLDEIIRYTWPLPFCCSMNFVFTDGPKYLYLDTNTLLHSCNDKYCQIFSYLPRSPHICISIQGKILLELEETVHVRICMKDGDMLSSEDFRSYIRKFIEKLQKCYTFESGIRYHGEDRTAMFHFPKFHLHLYTDVQLNYLKFPPLERVDLQIFPTVCCKISFVLLYTVLSTVCISEEAEDVSKYHRWFLSLRYVEPKQTPIQYDDFYRYLNCEKTTVDIIQRRKHLLVHREGNTYIVFMYQQPMLVELELERSGTFLFPAAKFYSYDVTFQQYRPLYSFCQFLEHLLD